MHFAWFDKLTIPSVVEGLSAMLKVKSMKPELFLKTLQDLFRSPGQYV